jgi:predicted MPP superfamily phosphohydrolase
LNIIPFEFSSEWDELELYPLSDLHIGDYRTDISAFRRFVQMIKEKPNRFLIYNGDNLNNATKFSVSNVYNDSMSPNEQRKFLESELMPIKDRFLAFVDGNHEYRTKRDNDLSSVEWLADKLGCKHYAADAVAIKISFGKGSNGKRVTYAGVATHGSGAGKFIGGTMNNLENFALMIENCDFVIVGHAHKKAGSVPGVWRMDLQNNVMVEREKICVVSSHWASYGGYALRKMMRISGKGSVPLILNGKEKAITGQLVARG